MANELPTSPATSTPKSGEPSVSKAKPLDKALLTEWIESFHRLKELGLWRPAPGSQVRLERPLKPTGKSSEPAAASPEPSFKRDASLAPDQLAILDDRNERAPYLVLMKDPPVIGTDSTDPQ